MEEKKKEKTLGNIVVPELKTSGTIYHVIKNGKYMGNRLVLVKE